MSKIQSYDKNIYPCIRDAVYEIMDRHLLVAGDVSIYDAAALNDVLFFLCENGIKHEYITMPAPFRAECDEVISLVWMEGKDYGNEVWYSRGETDAKKNFRVSLVVSAKDECEIENWLANVSDVVVMDWSVE